MQTLVREPLQTQAVSHDGARPLAGKRVVLVHPAWKWCGSHQVFVSQAQAYRQLGARVESLAIADFPGLGASARAQRAYFAATKDLLADQRHYAGMPLRRMLRPRFFNALQRWLRGDAARMLCETVVGADLPEAVLNEARIDLIHCNHFFCMLAAIALKGGRSCPVLLDSHDMQAKQFALRNESRWTLPPRARFEDMLALELAQMREADLLIHLNDEEMRNWCALLPGARHALIYPAIKAVPTAPGGNDILIVASANHPNYLSVAWFLNEVLPLAPDVTVRIIGNVDELVRARAPALFARYAALFSGRIDDLDAAYANAAAILLPTTSGHGISIKTIEALSSGAPVIATKEAFRGIAIDPALLGNVTLVSDAAQFAAALRELASQRPPGPKRAASDTRALYERLFSFDAYSAALATHVMPLLK